MQTKGSSLLLDPYLNFGLPSGTIETVEMVLVVDLGLKKSLGQIHSVITKSQEQT